MEHLGKTLDTNAATDTLVSRSVAELMAAMFLGPDAKATDPLANPLYADLAGFPPMYLTAGDHETLQDNAERLAQRAEAAGVDVTLEITPGQQHVFQFMAGRAREADESISRSGAWLRSKFGL
jgi:acetyl esterase/lipase